MNEKEKAKSGYLYDANYDENLIKERISCSELIYDFNATRHSEKEKRNQILKRILGKMGENTTILSPFHCDYGYNIKVGKNFFANYNFVVLDSAEVNIGDNVFIAPNVVLACAGHAIDEEQRNKGLGIAYKINIGNSVWIGANVTILPGVTIGDNVIIGAGSVVTKDIPSNVIAVGNPCRVLRSITKEDAKKYKIYEGK